MFSTTRLQTNMSQAAMIAAINQNMSLLENLTRSYVVADEEGDRRVLLGQGENGFSGLKVSQPGVDVTEATDQQLIFNSSQNIFKITTSGSTSLAVPSTMSAKQVVTATIPHGLSTAPAFLVYTTVPNYGAGYVGTNQINQLPFTVFTYNITPVMYAFASSDATNLYIKIANLFDANLSGVGGTWNFKYYIMQESAT